MKRPLGLHGSGDLPLLQGEGGVPELLRQPLKLPTEWRQFAAERAGARVADLLRHLGERLARVQSRLGLLNLGEVGALDVPALHRLAVERRLGTLPGDCRR